MFNEYGAFEVDILRILDSEDKWWKIEEISYFIPLSKPTIQKYIKRLRERIRNLYIENVYLEIGTRGLIYFNRYPSFNVQVIYTLIYKELLIYSILEVFLYKKKISSIQIASTNYISESSIRRKYKELNLYLHKFDMEIKLENLIGSEKQIRWFYSEMYWYFFWGVEWPFKLVNREFVYGVINEFERYFNFKINSGNKEQLAYWFAINALRRIIGYRVTEDIEIKKFISNNILFKKFVETLRVIFPAQAANNDSRDFEEAEYFFFHICSSNLIEKNEELSDVIYKSHVMGNTIMYQMSVDWMIAFEDVFGKVKTRSKWYKILMELLQIHSLSYLYIINSELKLNKNSTSEFNNYPPILMEKIEYIFDKINEKYQHTAVNKDYLIKNYILLVQIYVVSHEFKKEIRISLNLSNGNLYEQVIEKKLKLYLFEKYNLNFVSLSHKTDILVTDYYHSKKNELYTVVNVDNNLSMRDYANIEKCIHDMFKSS